MPVTNDYRGDRFFVRENGIRMATPLFVVLLLVEFSDLIFAVDSIPAIFAVTKDPFIVYTSNVFAILGLRSLYFALAGVMDKFHYLKIGLGVVLSFVGVKMLLAHSPWKIDTHLARSDRHGARRLGGGFAGVAEEAPETGIAQRLTDRQFIRTTDSMPSTTTQTAGSIVHAPWFQRFIIATIILAGVLAGIETDAAMVATHGPVLRTLDAIVWESSSSRRS